MFNVACKDPLEAESVGQRRERKMRESNRSSVHSSSSVSSDTASAKRLNLIREDLRSSRSNGTIPTFSSPGTSPLFEIPDPSIKAMHADPGHVRPAGPVDMSPTRWSDSNTSSIRHRSRHRNEQIELITERLQVGQPTFHDESPVRPGHGVGFEDVKDSSKKVMRTVAPPFRSIAQSPSTLNSFAKVSSEIEFASHQTEGAIRRRVHLPAPSSMIRFQRLLGKIEIANVQNSCKRLSEQWNGDDIDLEEEFHFETTLWALVGLEKICAIAQSTYLMPMTDYCLDGTSMAKIQDGMDVLHLGSVHDSPGAWYLGAKHTQATFCSLATDPSSLDLPSSSWGWPSNVESGLWDSCPSIPHPDNTFDVVLIHPIFHVLRCTDWPILIKEAVRVLIPGNYLAIQVMDCVPKRAGPLLEAWTTQYLALGLARKFMVSRPNLLVPCWIEEFASSSEVDVETTELPIHAVFTSRDAAFEVNEPSSPRSTNRKASRKKSLDTIDEDPGAQGREEVRTYASLVGKHLYRSMYEEFAPLAASLAPDGGPHVSTSRCWWWDDPEILDECRRFDAAFEMVTYVCRKDDTWSEQHGSA